MGPVASEADNPDSMKNFIYSFISNLFAVD